MMKQKSKLGIHGPLGPSQFDFSIYWSGPRIFGPVPDLVRKVETCLILVRFSTRTGPDNLDLRPTGSCPWIPDSS